MDLRFLVRGLLFMFFSMAVISAAKAQDTLPNFTVETPGNGRVVVSWANPYPNLIQLAVQRSYDSLKKFTTVFSSTSPELPTNGFSDQVPVGPRVYYRIFYVMEGGAYFFTLSKQPSKSQMLILTPSDNRRERLDEDLQEITEAKNKKELAEKIQEPERPIYFRIEDSLKYKTVLLKDFRSFRDSIMSQTKDTLVQTGDDTLMIRLYNPPFNQKTSEFIFTNKDGYIVIKLNDALQKKYEVSFMKEDETPVLILKSVKDPYVILDKTNFYKAGWYKFAIRENGRIIEKGKVYLASDF
jgi:hypothetical protein